MTPLGQRVPLDTPVIFSCVLQGEDGALGAPGLSVKVILLYISL